MTASIADSTGERLKGSLRNPSPGMLLRRLGSALRMSLNFLSMRWNSPSDISKSGLPGPSGLLGSEAATPTWNLPGLPLITKCQPGDLIPTPGSVVIIWPSGVTVPVPMISQRPASWLNDQNSALSPGTSPSMFGKVAGAGTSKLVAPSAWIEITSFGLAVGGRGAGSRSGGTGVNAACGAGVPARAVAEWGGKVTLTWLQTAGSTSGNIVASSVMPPSPKPTSVAAVGDSGLTSPVAMGGK